MSDNARKFARFHDEYARLRDPGLLRGALQLVSLDLRKFATDPRRQVKRKKKKRHGAAAAWSVPKVAAWPAAQPQVGEQLLPIDFLQKLLGQTQDAQGSATARGETPDKPPPGAPQIEVEPPSVARPLKLFQELTFALDAPATEQVKLVWREDRENARPKPETPRDVSGGSKARGRSEALPGELQQVVMDHIRADHFETRIEIADGSYLLGFMVDRHMRPDARFSRRLVLNGEGLFTPLTLARHTQTLRVTNKSKFNERVRLETNVPWLLPGRTHIDISPGSSVVTTLAFHPPAMRAGLNEGLLQLSVEREELFIVAGVVHLAVQAEAGGAVPAISFAPCDLGEIRQGLDESHLLVQVTAHGRGSLTGMISLPHSGELADFCLNVDDSKTPGFAHTFRIQSASLPQPQPDRIEAALKVMLVTDSFLANYRLYSTEIPYRLVHLKKSLPALSFGTVRVGGTKALRLEVSRSDKEAVELTVALPAGSASYLEAYPARADAYVFRFDTNALPPGTSISETVELIDRKSGLRDQVKVLATVAHSPGEPVRTEVGSNAS